MSRIKLTAFGRACEELRLLGIWGSAYRIGHEVAKKSGFTSLSNPIRRQVRHAKKLISLSTWRREKRPFFIPSVRDGSFIKALERLYEKRSRSDFLENAAMIIEGKIRCFSRWVGDFGSYPDWHRNPVRGVSWPANIHWSKVIAYGQSCGDIKLSWEINRFPHVYILARAYALTGDPKWVRCFTQQIESWESANPYRAGINWCSCQELAIRALAWIFALYVFGDDDAVTDDDFQRLQRQLYLHAEHIEKNISFSRYAVHNNHLIGEALGLYAIGSLFPWFNRSGKWQRVGKDLLTRDCLRQFYVDGGYCQLSHNYHRLALYYYIWASRIAESLGEPLSQEVYDLLDRSGRFLASFMNLDGRLPNWGANDGAYLNSLSQCDYADFRPLLTVIRFMTKGARAFGHGSWDEELLWFCGPGALTAKEEPYVRKSAAYPVTGVHVLRGDEGSFIAFRCGSVCDRFGQADQLHADIWWRGQNIAVDGGSYLYNDELQYHTYFMGTMSHNTVSVDGVDQMLLYRRFKWLYWTKARITKFKDNKTVAGEHYGYSCVKGNVTHRRMIDTPVSGTYIITDELTVQHSHFHCFRLHWMICDVPYDVILRTKNTMTLSLQTKEGIYFLHIMADRGVDWAIERGINNELSPRGWISRYYGEKIPAISIGAMACSSNGVQFISIFTDHEPLLREDYINGGYERDDR